MLQQIGDRTPQSGRIARRDVEAVWLQVHSGRVGESAQEAFGARTRLDAAGDRPAVLHHISLPEGVGDDDRLGHRHRLQDRRHARLKIDVFQWHHDHRRARVKIAQRDIIE